MLTFVVVQCIRMCGSLVWKEDDDDVFFAYQSLIRVVKALRAKHQATLPVQSERERERYQFIFLRQLFKSTSEDFCV